MTLFENEYEQIVMKTVFVKDEGKGHYERRITVKRRIPKIRMSKKMRIKKRWEGRERFCE